MRVVKLPLGVFQVLSCANVARSRAACTVRAVCRVPVSSCQACSITQASWPSTFSRRRLEVASIARWIALPWPACM